MIVSEIDASWAADEFINYFDNFTKTISNKLQRIVTIFSKNLNEFLQILLFEEDFPPHFFCEVCPK